MLIGATPCSVICENTVLLETQGPCGSVRECSADTVTDDTDAQVEDVTRAVDVEEQQFRDDQEMDGYIVSL